MATIGAKAIRGSQAREVLSERMAALSKRLNVEMPPPAPRSPDPELQPILETERQIAFMDSLLASLSELSAAQSAPAGYDALTVEMLKREVETRGLDVPTGARKADLVALLEEDDATTPDEDGGA